MTHPTPSPEAAPTREPASASSPTLRRIRTEPLSVDELLREVRHPGAGAVATFEGTVRNHNDGRPVTLLEYEAYGPMAETEIAAVLAEIQTELPEVRVTALHRIGPLQVGDAAVLCAASAPHRAEAFRACRLAIDRIKSRLPIWKREHGPQGPYWVGWEDARCSPDHDHAPPDHAHHDHAHHSAPDHAHADHAHAAHGHADHAHAAHGHAAHAHAAHGHADHAHAAHVRPRHDHTDHAHLRHDHADDADHTHAPHAPDHPVRDPER